MRYPGAIWYPTGNYWTGRGGITPKWLILHGTAGPNAVSWFVNPDNKDSSAHFVILVDGTVYQMVDTGDSAWGNGIVEAGHDSWWATDINPNLQTISIEHEKLDKDNANPLTDAQKKSSFALVKWICDNHKIRKASATADGGITGHYSISPGSRAHCPGNFPWSELWAAIGPTSGGGSSSTMVIPQGWHDDGKILTAPNGISVREGFRLLVLNNGATWGKDNFPEEEEREAKPLEYTNPGLGNGTQQIFRLCMLGWNNDRGVFVEYIGQEFMMYKKMLLASQQENVQLQMQVAALIQQLQNASTVQDKAVLKQIATLVAGYRS
jgi:hypothetical protein